MDAFMVAEACRVLEKGIAYLRLFCLSQIPSQMSCKQRIRMDVPDPYGGQTCRTMAAFSEWGVIRPELENAARLGRI